MKSINIFKLLMILVILSALSLIVSKIKSLSDIPAIPFVSGLKTLPATPIEYLPESNSSILDIDSHTIGVFSTNRDNFMLKQIFQTAGVPYVMTQNLTELNSTSILFLNLSIDEPVTLSKEQREFFYEYTSRGGIIIGNEILSTRLGALKALFGYRGYTPTKKHHELWLLDSPYYTYFDTDNEKRYYLSTIDKAPYSNSIILGTAKPIATYEDGDTAMSINSFGKGQAINLGVSLYDLRYRNLMAKDYSANKHYINDFEPLSDLIVMLIKGIYEKHFEKSVTLHTAKDGNQATLIMSHDVDFYQSMRNLPKFSKLEMELGFRATYNILVKYITDDKDRAFFIPRNIPYMLDLQKDGHEIGSHTIVHTKNFFVLPAGDCSETYPSYRPFSVTDLIDKGNPTVCGETKVSKELLLGAGVEEVVTFRSGHLYYHPHLPKILERYGYRYSSCLSAEDVLSYFPYRYMRNYEHVSEPSKIWEIPVVLEDEHMPPMYFRVDSALELFEKVYNNGGVYNILDHPDLTWYKLKNLDLGFIKSFYTQIVDDVWKATTKELGEFWDSRDRVVFRYRYADNRMILDIHSMSDIDGLTFQANGFQVTTQESVTAYKNKITIDIKKGYSRWEFELL